MWSAQLSRREFFEFYLGSTKAVEGRLRSTSQINVGIDSQLTLIWDANPLERFSLPSLVVVPEGDVEGVLGAVMAAPQAPSPVTSLTRVLSREEARQYFEEQVLPANDVVIPAVATLSVIEAILHADGRLGVRRLTPMICKRTLAFTWGRALMAGGTENSFRDLPQRWLDVYSTLNPPAAAQAARRNIEALIRVLSIATQLTAGMRPHSLGAALAFNLLHGSKDSQEEAWRRLSVQLGKPVGIETLQSLTREERGSHLQEALRTLSSVPSSSQSAYEDLVAACAFLATRLAPGSLDHIEVLRAPEKPELICWYGLFAALQTPREILSMQGGLGFRLTRDIRRFEDKLSPPSADIAFSEFKILSRGSVESIASKLGHASELQVELVPYVTGIFTFQTSNRNRMGDEQQLQDMESAARPSLSPRARLAQLATELAQLAGQFPETSNDYVPPKRTRRKTG
ncbi:hypothetical protein [Paraburkholderia sp.]|uniref:hypothetical protein n=1 Tax=Paraburkholderia sp. TaxID=1926495 RepID=UPI003C7ADE62